jgi:hypothetical protein
MPLVHWAQHANDAAYSATVERMNAQHWVAAQHRIDLLQQNSALQHREGWHTTQQPHMRFSQHGMHGCKAKMLTMRDLPAQKSLQHPQTAPWACCFHALVPMGALIATSFSPL